MRQGGFVLVLTLFLALILLSLGMGLLSQRIGQKQASYSSAVAAQALELAESGLEDARVKLTKDLRFPPSRSYNTDFGLPGDQFPLGEPPIFSYSEYLYDVDNAAVPVGRYTVSLDLSHNAPPYNVIQVSSQGDVFSVAPPQDPNATDGLVTLAQRRITAELDTDTRRPATYFTWINRRDEGSL